MLVGRGAELDALAGALSDGGAAVLVGEAGVGKTALLDELARTSSARVLRTAGAPTESELAFGGLGELLAPVTADVLALGGPRGDALASALALGPPSPGDRLAVAVGTLDVLRAVAPVLVVVDDLHWLDPESSECLLAVGRRCGGDGVALVAAARPVSLPEGHGLSEHHLAGLDPAAARSLLPDLPAHDAEQILALAEGNPLALRELPKALAGRAGESPGDPLDPGARVTACFAQRIERLSPGARRGLVLLAASHDGRLGELLRAYDAEGLTDDELAEAEAAEIVVVAGDRVRFGHPLLRNTAYHSATAAERRQAHVTLGAVVEGPVQIWHLAAAALGPDERVAQGLDAAAADAQARRGYHLASAAFERAAQLSEDDFAGCLRLLGAGGAAIAAGDVGRAGVLAQEALDRATDPTLAAGAEHLSGIVEMWNADAGRAERRLRAAAQRFETVAPDQAAGMAADAALAATSNGDCRRAIEDGRRALALTEGRTGPVRAHAGTACAWALLLGGQRDEAIALYDEVEPLLAEVDPLSPAAQSIGLALNIRSQTDDLSRARADALALSEEAERSGSLSGVAFPLAVACEAALRLGDWAGLEADYARATSLAGELGQQPPLAFLHASRARLRAARGEARGCHGDVAAARAIARPRSMHSIETYCLSALGLLALGTGDHEEAAALLSELRRSVEQHGQRHPTLVPWVAELTEALCRLDREREAREVLDDLAPWCAGHAGGALASLARALLSGGDFEPAFAEAEECAGAFPQAFEDARLFLALGERRRRAARSRDARAPLRAALTAFERLDARPWVERASAELRAAGGERSADGGVAGLTPQQLEIARAVARGARNREVASALFLSEKTVEYHLSRIYRVLGVRSRTELANTLAGDNQGFP